MAQLIQLRHPWRRRATRARHSWKADVEQPSRRRLDAPPWLPLLALIGLAAVLHFDVYSIRDFVFGPNNLVRNPASANIVAGHRTFRLCGGRIWQDCVIDGDTIQYGGTRIRLKDINAPETRDFKCASELALGRQATERLLELMNGGPFEMVHTGGRDTDSYGRKLRIIERNGRSVGETLIAEGLARPWRGARGSWCG